MNPLPAISRPVEIARIGAARSVTRVEIGAEERKALAAALGLVDILALSAELGLSRDRGGTIRLDGRLFADIVQSCVVSLEPVRQTIDEPIRLSFVEGTPGDRPPAVVDVAPTEDDPPEIVTGPLIDVGPAVVEHFLLAIDPYPRAPGAELPGNPARDTADTGDSPFSVLASLVGPKRRSVDR